MKMLTLSLIIILIAGCVSLKDFTEENDTLVVGELIYIHNDPKTKSVNGKYKIGISISIKNIQDDKVIKISTQNNGLFFYSKFTRRCI
jgi:hypothetical protein